MKHNNYSYLFEDEQEKTSATPGEVLSAIMGLPDSLAAKKIEFLKKLQGFAKEWKTKKTELVDAKKKLFDAASNGATKTVLRAAGVEPKDQPEDDGKTYKPKNTDIPKGADIDKAIKAGEWDGESLKYVTNGEEQKLEDVIKDIEDKEKQPAAKTPEAEIQDLKNKGFTEEMDDTKRNAKITLDEPSDGSPAKEVPEYEENAKEIEGKKYGKKLTKANYNKETGDRIESNSYNYGSSTVNNTVLERNSRIVPTFESYMQSRGLK